MNERSTFELRLAATFEAYADRAPMEVDAVELASAIASERRSGWLPLRWFASRSLAVQLLLATLLLAVAGAAVIVGASLLIDAPPLPAPYDRVFAPAGQMSEMRFSPLVIQLDDGRVLIAGGFGDEIPAEIFDPVTGATQRLDGPTPSGQYGSSVRLPDGKVLMIAHNDNHTTSRAWVFDPATESFHEISQPGPLNAPPFGVRPGVAGLRDGRVLVAGGTNDAMTAKPFVLASAMIFDPVSETFAPTGSMSIPRVDHSTTALPNGRVLVAGGWTVWPERLGLSQYVPGQPSSGAEIYDPQTGTFTPTGSMPSVTGPNMAVALPDGRVLVMSAPVERSDGLPTRPPVAIDIYDPASGQFTAMPRLSLAIDQAVALRDGRVLLAGAHTDDADWETPPWAAIYDPSDGSLEQVPAPTAHDAGITTLRDGTVLFAGGIADDTWRSVEIFR